MTFISSNGRRAMRRSLLVPFALGTALTAYTGAAFAGDLSVTTALTDPISTSVGDGGGAGSINITTSGSVTLSAADGAVGAATLDSGSESITNAGSIIVGADATEANNAGQNGILVTADTTGGVVNSGTIKTGTTQTTDSAGVPVIVGVGADAAVLIQGSLGTGFDNTGTISTIASSTNAYAFLVQGNLTPITFGNIGATTYSIHNKGSIYSIGYVNGNAAIGMGFVGSVIAPITISGINNETGGTIQATSANDDATGLDIGAFTSITDEGIVNGGLITGAIVSPTTVGTATGIHIGATGSVTEINNSGTISASSAGTGAAGVGGGDAFAIDVDALGSLTTITNNANSSIFASSTHVGDTATAIRDQSGTLATITNAGSISGSATATGTAIAIDLRGAGTTVIANTGTIVGQINLGTGNYTLNGSDGLIISDFTINGGAAFINLTGDTVMTAASTLVGGTLDFNAATGTTLRANAGDFNVTNITFDGGATYAVSYDTATATPSGNIVASTATMHDGAIVNVTLTSYLGAATPTITVVETSTALNFDTPADPSGLVIGGIGAGYNAVLATANANRDLTVTLSRKTATQLGLSSNAASIYDASVGALEADTTFGAAVGNLSTVGAVVDLYNQLLPDLSSARERQAIRMQDVAAGFVNDRLNLMRTVDQGAGDGGGKHYNDNFRRSGMWLQEAVSNEKGDGDVGTQGYDGTLYALALGYDARDKDGDVWGGSLSYASMSYDAGLSSEDSVAKTTMVQIYHSLNRGIFFWDAMGAVALNKYNTNRTVIAGSVARTANADWSGYQGGLSSQIGVAGTLGSVTFRPSAGLAYTYLSQDGYTEAGGGTGVNLKVDSSTFSSLRANAELRVSSIFFKEPQIVPYVRGGISQELMDTEQETKGSFVSTGSTFLLQNTELDKSSPFVGAGVSFVGGYSRLSFEYTGQLGDKFTSHQGVATASLMF